MNCPTCETEYTHLGKHLAHNEDHRPELSPFQRDLVSFLSLAGVSVRNGAQYPRFEIFSVGEDLVRATADALGWLANEPRLYQTAEEGVERSPVDSHVSEWNDLWAVSTLPHPELEEYGQPTDVTSLTPRVVRWLVLACGEWVASGPFGSLWLDTRGLTVDGDHLRDLLRDAGVTEFCPDSKWPASLTHRGHWRDEIVALPHGWAMSLIDAGGLDLGDVLHSGRLTPTDGPLEIETDLAAV